MTKKILSFKGIQYNPDFIDSYADVVTPPYDVISPEMQDEFYARSPYNFCRVDFPKEEGSYRYEKAGQLYAQWLSEGVLATDAQPAIYVHHQSFTLPDGRKVIRKGFLAARRIESFTEGGIKPHEKTLDGPKADRLNMTRATKVNLSPVFSLYSDPERLIEKRLERLVQTTPGVDFVSADGERHQVWKLKDPETCDFIDAQLSDKPLFIADGHHRYETALNYRDEIRGQHTGLSEDAAANSLLMYFSNLNDDGLVILPIHRALHNLKDFSLDDFTEKLGTYFNVTQLSSGHVEAGLAQLEAEGKANHTFWMITRDPETAFLLTLNREKWLASDLAKTLPAPLACLDVTVLHRLVFEHILGMTEEAQASQENIIYWKSTQKAMDETRKGHCELTFLLNPTRIQDMESVAMAGFKMPQKSTYFYPKIVSGLIMHDVSVEAIDG